LTKAEFTERFAPTADEANKVAQFLTSNKLKIAKVGPDNFYVRATGTAADISAAFHVTLNNYELNGKTVRANSEDPSISGDAAELVNAVSGLDSLEYTHPLVTRTMTAKTLGGGAGVTDTVAKTSVAAPAASSATETSAAAAAILPASDFNSDCFPGKVTETFTTSGALPKATYKGNEYTTNAATCGYTPKNIRAAYGLNPVYGENLDGTGQTIVILDWCGSPTITSDANAFSAQFGLPKLTAKNFKIIYTPTPSSCEAPDTEINLDVEWAHAIAPGAAIDLVVPPSSSFQDVDEGLFYAVDYQLGNNISGSFGSEELYTDPTVLITEDLIAETAAVLGISANFSTGDEGDFTGGYPFIPASVSAPADSPYATAVGGVSVALNSNNTIAWQTGWGTNENLVSDEGEVEDPPVVGSFFNFGSGGGASAFFLQPYFQSELTGSMYRQLPDISWVGDPFTGVYVAISEPFAVPELQYTVVGGTSLSCPMFSALWAIANQAAGEPLGQAAPYLYSLPSKAITDIVPVTSSSNVTAVITDSAGKTSYSAASLVNTLDVTNDFISVLWNYPLYEDTAFVVSFGTDASLTTGPGWDNVTGVGVPNAKAFVDAFKQ
jgi:subtilase family serine protease